MGVGRKIYKLLSSNKYMKKKVLDLENREEAEKEMRSYLKLECPHYLGSKPASVELVHDVAIKLFEGEERRRVLVYDVKLQDKSEAFGTIGGILYPHQPPYSNVFPKTQVKDTNTAASMHLYWEARNRFGNTSLFSKKENLEEFAEILEIPKELR